LAALKIQRNVYSPGELWHCKWFINVNNSETLEYTGEKQKSYELVARPGGSY